ncbi:class I SAM-dependent methyltransferase [Sedimenticola sp.]|uniref:class I SAM-dependent methyltransferase n=2 Tax=Sedimenticola sp. TaxID=1940285 RepID=UPI003D0EE4D4
MTDLLRKIYREYAVADEELKRTTRKYLAIKGAFLFPFYILAGALVGVPGLYLRIRCAIIGVKVLFKGNFLEAYRLIVNPLDSVRYFELSYLLESIEKLSPKYYLDVSSPRLLPLLICRFHKLLKGDLLNPSNDDLERTKELARLIGVANRCHFINMAIEELGNKNTHYDLITCVSVLEHIVDDKQAIATMWESLCDGGTLMLTVPVARNAFEEYTNINEYKLLNADNDGFVFWQRYYDHNLLAENIFSVTGIPVEVRIFAEKTRGGYDRNVKQKREDILYPFWKEPYITAKLFKYVDDLSVIDGMGVIAMVFKKSFRKSAEIFSGGLNDE